MSIAIVTYTNNKYCDIWPMHFGQLTKYVNVDSYVISDVDPRVQNHTFLKYQNDDDYYKHWVNALNQIDYDYIIYSQDDHTAIGKIDMNAFSMHTDFLSNHKEYSYIRPFRCGFNDDMKLIVEHYYEAPQFVQDIFQMQITIWKRHDFIKLYERAKSKLWFEGKHWTEACTSLNIRGLFTYHNDEKKIGKYHYECKAYPHICTAISKGKWNYRLYENELKNLHKEYNINPNIRGIIK